MNLFEDETPAPGNAPEFTVSELSGAVKRVIEGEFGLVRVRGEIGRVSRPASGHLYFDLKDDRAVLAAICWKGQAGRLAVRPDEGLEVVATGRMTTFPGQSKYQLIVEDLAPAGAGALMAMLEKRRQALAAEGLFAPERKQQIPYLPEVIGVVTSPSGAVIRDILHRLRERFPRRVLIWPVAVQGEKCAPEVAAAIRGFNMLEPGGPVPRPDLIIVARGGGSIEDLWGFNDEAVVRAAAASRIPLISAIGHETDVTLIDHAADLRAPTPTAAAEIAVPVRAELREWTAEQGLRLSRAARARTERAAQRVGDLSRGLARPEALLAGPRQRLDLWSDRLPGALRGACARKRAAHAAVAGRLNPPLLTRYLAVETRRLGERAGRLGAALARVIRDEARDRARQRTHIDGLAARLDRAWTARLAEAGKRLSALDRTRLTLGYRETLARGFALVWRGGSLVSSRAAAASGIDTIEFHDGRLPLAGRKPDGGQGELF